MDFLINLSLCCFWEEVVYWIRRPHTATVSELQIVHLLSVPLIPALLLQLAQCNNEMYLVSQISLSVTRRCSCGAAADIAHASQETISVACCLINQSPFRTPINSVKVNPANLLLHRWGPGQHTDNWPAPFRPGQRCWAERSPAGWSRNA